MLSVASLCLTLLILTGMMKSKFVTKVLFPILKYAIVAILGYIGGDVISPIV